VIDHKKQPDRSQQKPDMETLWQWLHEVPDPEIPVVSVVDLGIVRDIQWDENTVVVTVTPTYSGCPATRIINEDIEKHLFSKGVASVRMVRQLSPAWRTAWISDSARRSLLELGIAPPVEDAAVSVERLTKPFSVSRDKQKPVVVCPRCQSGKTEMVSQFGSTPCKASYRCLDCLEPFDYFKCL